MFNFAELLALGARAVPDAGLDEIRGATLAPRRRHQHAVHLRAPPASRKGVMLTHHNIVNNGF